MKLRFSKTRTVSRSAKTVTFWKSGQTPVFFSLDSDWMIVFLAQARTVASSWIQSQASCRWTDARHSTAPRTNRTGFVSFILEQALLADLKRNLGLLQWRGKPASMKSNAAPVRLFPWWMDFKSFFPKMKDNTQRNPVVCEKPNFFVYWETICASADKYACIESAKLWPDDPGM